jgi:acyl carrier protein
MRDSPTPELIRSLLAETLGDPSLRAMDVQQRLDEVVDSFALIELLTVSEQRFGVSFRKEHLSAENWRSLTTIADLIQRIQKETPG